MSETTQVEVTPTVAPGSDSAADNKAQVNKLVAEGKKAIALKDWEVGVEKYADALDIM
jgi:HAT1-interacting factor 1